MDLERREILFAGRVQGVGFRYTTHRIATGFKVCGFVQNLSDGRVKVVVEGEAPEIDRFVEAVKDEMQGRLEEVEQTVTEPKGDHLEFEIRH